MVGRRQVNKSARLLRLNWMKEHVEIPDRRPTSAARWMTTEEHANKRAPSDLAQTSIDLIATISHPLHAQIMTPKGRVKSSGLTRFLIRAAKKHLRN